MSNILNKMKKITIIKNSDVLDNSIFFESDERIPTPIYTLNIALSGRLDGGLTSGLTQIAGPSGHFKSLYGLLMVKSFLEKYKDGICLLYDSEFGTPLKYFQTFGIDTSRVLHIPITNIEEFKFDLMKKLDSNSEDAIKREDKVIIFVDSIGNLASVKEVEDAINSKSVADMSRAKSLKSVFRMVTPCLKTLDIPMVIINHVYSEQGMFPKTIVSGGQGASYSPNCTMVVGKSQLKDGASLEGFCFKINIYKSRYVKEKSVIPIDVTFDGGISPYSGLFEIALETGDLTKPKNGWYKPLLVDKTTGEVIENEKLYRQKDCQNKEFWDMMLNQTFFKENVEKRYTLGSIKMLQDEEV